METIQIKLAKLIDVKSIVTLLLTAVFAYLSCVDKVTQEFMTVYTVIIAFYFGTVYQKRQDQSQGQLQ